MSGDKAGHDGKATVPGINLDFGRKGRFFLGYLCFRLTGLTSITHIDTAPNG